MSSGYMDKKTTKRRYVKQSVAARLVNEAIRQLSDKPYLSVQYKRVEDMDEQVSHSLTIKWSELA